MTIRSQGVVESPDVLLGPPVVVGGNDVHSLSCKGQHSESKREMHGDGSDTKGNCSIDLIAEKTSFI